MSQAFDRSRQQDGGLSADAFEAIRSMIHDYCGIYFQESKRYLLESRVNQRMQAERVRSYDDYIRLLQRDGAAGELSVLVDAVTINETYFFRHEAQLALLEEELLPQLIRRKSSNAIPRVRIWSAACSSGDEAYSLAILIREKLQPLFPRAMIEIVATDIDRTILAAAKRASYSEYAVRNVPEPLLKRYFTCTNGRFMLDPTVRDMVRFRHLNLLDPLSMRSMRDFDVILCANVLIYFDGSAKRRALELLHQSLNAGGYFFVGFSETLYGLSEGFRSIRHEKSFVYQRLQSPIPESTAMEARPFAALNQSS